MDQPDRLERSDLEDHLLVYLRLLLQRDRDSSVKGATAAASSPTTDDRAASITSTTNINDLLTPWKHDDRSVPASLLHTHPPATTCC